MKTATNIPSVQFDHASFKRIRSRSLFDHDNVRTALRRSVQMLNPKIMARNPVMFITELGAAVTTLVLVTDLAQGQGNSVYTAIVAIVLWATVWFGNFAEALAEARGKAQADSLRKTRRTSLAIRVGAQGDEKVSSTDLRVGDRVRVRAGDLIPGDGEVVEGVAAIDESAITGESAPVIREAGSDRSGVTGGTQVLSDEIIVRIAAAPGQSFLDRMIALVEGAIRQKTPNELALTVTLAGLTLAFLIVTVALYPMGNYFGIKLPIPTLIALLVCLIPTTIGALLAAISLAGMDRALAANIMAKSGKAVELAGDIDTLLLDKTGTITLGNRQASRFVPAPGVPLDKFAEIAVLASLGDSTPEGKSIVEFGRKSLGSKTPTEIKGTHPIEFSASTRVSGVDLPDGRKLRKGAVDAIKQWVKDQRGEIPEKLLRETEEIASRGATPLLVSEGGKIMGLIALSDVLKPGIQDRITRLRAMGLRVIMLTGDNHLTAAAIAAEAGVTDFVAEAKPEDKLQLIRKEQEQGRLVAMMGDGTNDAPALAQADIGIAMNSGTQAAKEAGNMVDLDSDPTKLIEVIEIGKQLLMTRGTLTTFSIANDVAKYFAIVPAMFMLAIPSLAGLNIMGLATPQSAVLSAVIFNAIIIPLLIPIAIKGVKYRPVGAGQLLQRNLMIYGLGGVVVPFVGIKLIDLCVAAMGLA